ncbi:DNA polymerase epsilon noncatalytic subunit LALA0_S07e05974g [Lachancea lanzarotensis]|uniref:DNA polymerase epsilon subunit D n=1 Tax=Lachancea lanzarotensis TaxID=1245769 RepID=A0A0C7N9M1_9SACH|nr:uncharacterized protein LALA0_S07e05974g [Lachancea lanzarotensis]CEP63255.1 LALA0S07e05974g1_1 [Lachancea lanzarotensis]
MAPKSTKLPVASHAKEQQNVSIEDLLFPRSTIANLAKDSALSGAQQERQEVGQEEEQKKIVLSKDAVTALQRAATVFVNYLMVSSRDGATSQNRKSCNVDDVLTALDHCGLEGLKSLVRERLDEYNRALELRKLDKEQGAPAQPEATELEDEGQEIQNEASAKRPKVDN